jgi:hypothetical protein
VNTRLRAPSSNIRNFTLFSVARINCPFAKCVAAANSVCNDVESILSKESGILEQSLRL